MNLIKATFTHFQKHNTSRMGASLAYYAVFAIVPVSLLLINIGLFFFSKTTVEHEIVKSFSSVAGKYLESYFKLIISSIPNGLGLISVVLNLAIAIGVFSVLRKDLNELWEVRDEQNMSLVEETKHLVREKFVAFSVVPILALFMITSISMGIVYSNLKSYLNNYANISALADIASFLLPVIFSVIFFAFVYKIFPKIKLPWREVLLGAFITTVLFFIGNILIGLYLHIMEDVSIFSTAGAFAILLAWIYYSAQVFFLGASFTYVYSKNRGYLSRRIISRGSMQY
jgi:membrane protein